MMQTDKVRLPNERETYLSTLYGKALDNRAEHPILGDTFADEVVHRIDFDFEKLNLPQGGAITLPMRAKHLDSWAREFLDAHPESTVLHLGCGLDSRVFRIDPPATVRWYDVDLPDVIELRRRLYPERHDYADDRLVGDRSALVGRHTRETGRRSWSPRVWYSTCPSRTAVALFNRITGQFPSGQIIFDAYSRLTVRRDQPGGEVDFTGGRSPPRPAPACFCPGGSMIPRELEKEVPRLRLVTAIPFLTMPELVKRLVRTRARRPCFPACWSVSSGTGRSMQHLRYEF